VYVENVGQYQLKTVTFDTLHSMIEEGAK
jgi:hypothetical protein